MVRSLVLAPSTKAPRVEKAHRAATSVLNSGMYDRLFRFIFFASHEESLYLFCFDKRYEKNKTLFVLRSLFSHAVLRLGGRDFKNQAGELVTGDS